MRTFSYTPERVIVNEQVQESYLVDIMQKDAQGRVERHSAYLEPETIPSFVNAVLSVKSGEEFTLEGECEDSIAAIPTIMALVTPTQRYEFKRFN